MSITWIRHGEKQYKNGKAPEGCHGYDPPLKTSVYNEFERLCNYIKSKDGIPKKIITSPFLRTRQTAQSIANEFMETTKTKIPIFVDNDITEFLGWRDPKGEHADVDSVTRFFIDPILGVEKIDDVKRRVQKHIDSISSDSDILVITHGIVIQFIYRHFTKTKLSYIKELNGIKLKGDTITKFRYKEKK
jgi:broad specificity phosphatase PhoE